MDFTQIWHQLYHTRSRSKGQRAMIQCNAATAKIGVIMVNSADNSDDIQAKFYADRPRGTPPLGELNTRGVTKYSDFGPFRGYISETVHDRR